MFSVYRCIVKDSDYPSKYFRQIFEESISVKISPCQNFALYSISYITLCEGLNSSTLVYPCLLLFTHVYLISPMLPLFAFVYSCLLIFTLVYWFYVYHCLPMFTHASSCLSMFTLFTLVSLGYPCLPMFTLVYSCLLLFAHTYLCLIMFTMVYLVFIHLFTLLA